MFSKTTTIFAAGLALAVFSGCKKQRAADGPMPDGGATVISNTAAGAQVDAQAMAKVEPVASADAGTAGMTGQPPEMKATGDYEKPTAEECKKSFTVGTAIMMAEAMKRAPEAERAKLKLGMKDQIAKMEPEAVKRCLETPRDSVQCSMKAKTLSDIMKCEAMAQSQMMPDWSAFPGPKASAADCAGLGKHVEKIMASDPRMKQLPKDQRALMQESLAAADKQCVGMPKEALACLLSAKEVADLAACGQKSGGGAGGGPGGGGGGMAPPGGDPHGGHGH